MAGPAANSPRRPAPKRYACQHPGCGKAFTRSGHLLRHSQNHTDVAWACDRCDASFKREDLLERHKARHGIKDKRAGGTGLGKLVTKKHNRQNHLQRQRQRPELPGIDNNFLLTGGSDDSNAQQDSSSFPYQLDGASPRISQSSRGSPVCDTHDTGALVYKSPYAIQNSNAMELEMLHNAQRGDDFAMANDRDQYSEFMGGLSPSMSRQDLSHIPTPPGDELAPDNSYLDLVNNNDIEDFINSLAMLEQQTHVTFDPFRPEWSTRGQNEQASTSRNDTTFALNIDPMLQDSVDKFAYTESGGTAAPKNDAIASDQKDPSDTSSQHTSIFHLPVEVRENIIHLILETHPVTPSGTAISMITPELSLASMQESLDLFASHFNTSYPLIHLATFNAERVDRVLLLAMILLGSTYKNKDAHQLSVCLYDALIPHVFGGLSNNSASPELHKLQSLLLLDCYGMYRAGPSQRHNALLLHRVLLNSISIMSRYHVKAKIGLPAEMIMSAEQSFSDFAYVEQYKRLVLLFFMWDVQNACFFSVTPSLSVEELDITLPCTTSTWAATTEAEWKASRLNDTGPESLASAVKFYLDDGADTAPREDMLNLTLSLHGLMSICNGMRRSSDLHTFHEILDAIEMSSTTWRTNICNALEFWKARFDAFAMDNIQALDSEILHCDFQRDSMGVFAIYRAAYIVVNVEVRHLQIAAGAATIFGHSVEESDYAVSREWVQKWAEDSPEEVGRAAWQAGQMFREGMLNLKDWCVHDVFHYPWSLYLATLTCWAASQFSPLPAQRRGSNIGNSAIVPTAVDDSRKEMNRLVSMLASTNPSNMVRLVKKCDTRGLTREMAKYLRTVRWAAAHEAMIVLEELSTRQQ